MPPCPHPCRSAPTAPRPICATSPAARAAAAPPPRPPPPPRARPPPASARLPALANALDGLPREQAARLAGMTGQTLGDWVHRWNAEGVEGLRERPRPGRPCALDEGRQAALKALVLRGPSLERDGRLAGRARDLCALVEARFGVRYRESGTLRLPKGLDLSWQKTRPVHPEADPRAQERFKKPCPA